MKLHGWYPTDDAGRALRWRLEHVTNEIPRGQQVGPDLALELLTIVVCPPADLLEQSLAAVREEAVA